MKISNTRTHRKPRRNFGKLEKRRRNGMRLLASGVRQAEVARRCEVSETTVFRWKQAQASKGPSAWRRGRLGRPPGKRRPGGAEGHLTVHGQRHRFPTVLN